MSQPMTQPLLSCAGVRIVDRGAVVADQLDFTAEGGRLVLAGDWGPLFRLLSHQASLTFGTVTIDGKDARHGVRTGAIGLSLLDPPFSHGESTSSSLEISAELAGVRRRVARRLAVSILERLGLARLKDRPVHSLDTAGHRALAIAQGVITDPAVLVAETPLCRLDGNAGRFVHQVLERAAAGRKLIVSVDSPWSDATERGLMASADQVALMRNGQIVTVAPPAELLAGSKRYVVATTRNGLALAEALTARGLDVTRLDPGPSGDTTGAGRLLVDLTAAGGSTDPLVEAALSVEAPLVEMVPLESKA